MRICEGHFAIGALAGLAIWVFAVLPWLYGPAPRFAETGQPPQTHSENTEQNSAQKPDGTASAPYFIRIPKTAQETAQEAEERKEKASTDRWLMIFTGAVAIFTLMLVGATVLLYRAGERQIASVEDNFKKQLAESRKIAERNWGQMADSISVNLEVARAASSQAESAARQAEIAEKAFSKTERPYVLISSLSFIKPPKITEELMITKHHVTYKVGNFGRLAALIHDIRHVFQVAKSGNVPDNPFSSDPPHRVLAETTDAGYAIAAGEVIDKQWFVLPDNVSCRENNGWLDPELSGGQTVFMFVRVRYEDVSGPIRDRVDTWKYDFSEHQFLRCGGKDHNYERITKPA